jgi:ketosteroid isomerase-like protein
VSQENVDLGRQFVEAFNRGDVDACLGFMDPDVDFSPIEVGLEGAASLRGHEGFRGWWDTQHAIFPDIAVEIHEIRDLGDLIIMRSNLSGHGAGSDAFFEQPLWVLAKWRDGHVVTWRSFANEDEILAAVELVE